MCVLMPASDDVLLQCRAVPNKRGMAAVATLLGGTYGGFVRYFFGRWIPTFEQLMYNKVPLLSGP